MTKAIVIPLQYRIVAGTLRTLRLPPSVRSGQLRHVIVRSTQFRQNILQFAMMIQYKHVRFIVTIHSSHRIVFKSGQIRLAVFAKINFHPRRHALPNQFGCFIASPWTSSIERLFEGAARPFVVRSKGEHVYKGRVRKGGYVVDGHDCFFGAEVMRVGAGS